MPETNPLIYVKFGEFETYTLRGIVTSLYKLSNESGNADAPYLGTRRYSKKYLEKTLRAISWGMESADLEWPKILSDGPELSDLDKFLTLDKSKIVEMTMEFDVLEVLVSILKEYVEANPEEDWN